MTTTTPHTLSELAQIGSVASMEAIGYDHQMKTRLLVYFHEVRTPEAVRGENGKLLGFTKPFTDRGGQCCLEVTREQWTELQRHRWASPVLEIGFLIPDVDFVAQDGTVFQDASACLAHERALLRKAGYTHPGIVPAKPQVGETVNAPGFEPGITGSTPVPAANQERAVFVAAGICSDVVQYNNGEFCNASTELRYQQWLFETGKISEPTVPSGPPLYTRAWNKLKAPMRLKDLAAAMGVDAETLKASLEAPESTVEIGHAGWVKRREPKA